MTPEQPIDAALDFVLRASGSSLKRFTVHMDSVRAILLREAMRKVMSESYIQGSNDNFKAMKKGRP